MSLIAKDLDSRGNRSWRVTTEPTVEPVTVDELKTFGRIDTSAEDTLIGSMISAVRKASELYTGRAFIEQIITLVMDFWPSETIYLPRPPVISITGIYTVDEDDAATEYDSDYYFVDTVSEPGCVVLRNGVTAPSHTARYTSGYKIVYKAGYGDAASDVPEIIKQAILIWTMDYYENRVINPLDPPVQVKGFLELVKIPRGI